MKKPSENLLFAEPPSISIDLRSRETFLHNWIRSLLLQRDHLVHLLEKLATQSELPRESDREKASHQPASSLFEHAFQHFPLPIVITTLDEDRMVFFNPAFSEFTGWQLAEAVGNTAAALELWNNSSRRKAMHEQLRNTESLIRRKASVKLKNGTQVDVLIVSAIFEFKGHRLLVNGLIQWPEQPSLDGKPAREEQYFPSSPGESEAGFFVSSATGQLLECNPSFQKIFGFASQEQARATSLQQIFFTREQWERLLARIQWQGKLTGEEMVLKRMNEKAVQVVAHIWGQFNEQKELTHLRGFVLDITEAKIQENRIRQKEKLETLGRLITGVTHDYNNMLTVVQGYTELARNHLANPSKAQQALTHVQEALQRARQITRKLLQFSRVKNANPSVTSVHRVLDGFLPFLAPILGETVQLNTGYSAEEDCILMDPAELEQVLMNLLLNARDAMPQGGQIQIRTENCPVEDNHSSTTAGLGAEKFLLIHIQDSGTGMNEETKSRIFEPFYTTKERDKGSGIGLAAVNSIVQKSGGFIHVRSKPGAGTTFSLYLPVCSPPLQTTSTRNNEGPMEDNLRGNETILIVEDDQLVSSVIRDALHLYGYRTMLAHTLEDMKTLLNESGQNIHGAVCDLVLPDGSSLQMLQHLLKDWPELPVLVISGYPEFLARAEGMPVDEFPYLQKPFYPLELVKTVRQLLDRKNAP